MKKLIWLSLFATLFVALFFLLRGNNDSNQIGSGQNAIVAEKDDGVAAVIDRGDAVAAIFDRRDAVTIALGGFFDLDGDGISDVEKLKQMIVQNGGRVVASHDGEGNITGKLEASTRFLVLGSSQKTEVSNVTEAVAMMREQAKKNSVDVIDLRKLQSWIGFHGNTRIERTDRRIGESIGFMPRTPEGL